MRLYFWLPCIAFTGHVLAFVSPRTNQQLSGTFTVDSSSRDQSSASTLYLGRRDGSSNEDANQPTRPLLNDWKSKLTSIVLGGLVVSTGLFGLPGHSFAGDITKYDGFAEYAKENQMEKSDVGCFISKCGDQTKDLFSNPRGIKGVSCLGRCKGEQSCATRCFAEFGSESLNNWLSCTIEENECVKVPKDIDNSAEGLGYSTVVKNFDPKSLVGTWYKTDGLNPNYDLFDCQTNTFKLTAKDELDMGIFFRVRRPAESGGGFWENALTEHMVVDAPEASNTVPVVAAANAASDSNDMNSAGRTMHTAGKMYGLQFSENWYILGESDGSGGVPPFKLVAYKGHTLQGNYEGAFVYSKEPVLPEAAKPAIREAASKAGLDFGSFTRIDNTCPAGASLNDAEAGTGTSTTDWIDLVVGEGGVIDWISPGWRGEYKK
uniref:VDE lipocalin domain-containing protein n=1 Tax=Amphora coffeiformis TaxID=265554 RepID=A0A7S3P6I1_9STRA|eukprot:scaffold1267_cov171-Amphora_coffeaeformis.AAC.8